MKGSWRIAQIAGVRLYVHWTVLILSGWFALIQMRLDDAAADNVRRLAEGTGLALMVLVCLLLHEAAHAVVAWRHGIGTQEVTLLPLGGVARLEATPEEPTQELWIALAGPAVHLAIAGGIYGLLDDQAAAMPWSALTLTGGPFLLKLMAANLALGVLNLLPAMPLDGGRVLRAVLAFGTDYAQATRVAAGLGYVLCVASAALGLFSNPLWLFVSLAVLAGAKAEAHTVQTQAALGNARVRQAMRRRLRTVTEDETLADVVGEVVAGEQLDFPVVRDERLVGMLFQKDLLRKLSDEGRSVRVSEVLRRAPALRPTQDLADACQVLRELGCTSLPVVQDGHLVGLLTLKNMAQWTTLYAALHLGSGAVHDDDEQAEQLVSLMR
ncbi:MAG: CBS domain-containing protein [Planctomycetia bacterium]|nr:CBS domain-containing protein [Planctomycetia bacterium]